MNFIPCLLLHAGVLHGLVFSPEDECDVSPKPRLTFNRPRNYIPEVGTLHFLISLVGTN
jgi:hypothetical protein